MARRDAWLQTMEQALQLRELPVHPHDLQSHAGEPLALVAQILAQNALLHHVELVAHVLGQPSDGVGENGR